MVNIRLSLAEKVTGNVVGAADIQGRLIVGIKFEARHCLRDLKNVG